MTEPVSSVGKASEIDRRKSTKERLWTTAWHVGHDEEAEQDDTVQISEEARQRASGKIRKTILEHLAEDEDAE